MQRRKQLLVSVCSIRLCWILSIGVFLSFPSKGQPSWRDVFSQDTASAFTLGEFYEIVLRNHPVVSQAGLLNEMAKQDIRSARGAFDPKLITSLDHKEFQDKTYYSKLDVVLNMPTAMPIHPKVGYQNHSGALLSPEEIIPGQQQIFAGITLPIGRGLITDERRTAVQQARQMLTLAEADKVKMINKVLLEGTKAYWDWYHAHFNLKLLEQNVEISNQILLRTRLNAVQGEAAPVDTIQAAINYQLRLVERQEAFVSLQNALIQVSNYLWNDSLEPVTLSGAIPSMTKLDSAQLSKADVDSLVSFAAARHPELASLDAKISQMELERKLAREMLKPQLDLSYFALSQPSQPRILDLTNDYRFGLDFSIPVLLRKERSKVSLVNAKLTTAKLQKDLAGREFSNQVIVWYNRFDNTRKVIDQQMNVVDLYQRLLKAELLNLDNGESDLFKINVQQEKLIQAQEKLLKSTTEMQKEKATMYWAAGVAPLH